VVKYSGQDTIETNIGYYPAGLFSNFSSANEVGLFSQIHGKNIGR